MNSINRVILLGRIGSIPELKHTARGKAFCRLGFATSYNVKRDDEWRETTEWHSVVIWDHQAEIVCRYLGKGSPCIVEGRLSSRTYEEPAGVRRRFVEIVAERVTFLPDANSARRAARDDRQPTPDPAEALTPEEPGEDGVGEPMQVTMAPSQEAEAF